MTWPVVYEFLRVATHPRVFPQPLSFSTAWAAITSVIDSQAAVMLGETNLHREMLERCAVEAPRLSGNLPHDFHLAVLMREHGVAELLTLDQDFRAFAWVVIRPI